jgi:hypothetical protein
VPLIPSAFVVGDEWQEMLAVLYRSIRADEHALSARHEYLTKYGELMQGGPDRYAWLSGDEALPRLPDGQPTDTEANEREVAA